MLDEKSPTETERKTISIGETFSLRVFTRDIRFQRSKFSVGPDQRKFSTDYSNSDEDNRRSEYKSLTKNRPEKERRLRDNCKLEEKPSESDEIRRRSCLRNEKKFFTSSGQRIRRRRRIVRMPKELLCFAVSVA